jgi:transposase
VTDRKADANDSRSLRSQQNDGHYVTDSNDNHNHDLKDIFKGAAMRASTATGPLHDFYEALLAKGRKPTMARLTLARKIAAITLIVWKKEVRFDANYLKQQAA